MDRVFALYYNGEMYKQHGARGIYYRKEDAERIITMHGPKIAAQEHKVWENLNRKQKAEFVNKIEQRFRIAEFKEIK